MFSGMQLHKKRSYRTCCYHTIALGGYYKSFELTYCMSLQTYIEIRCPRKQHHAYTIYTSCTFSESQRLLTLTIHRRRQHVDMYNLPLLAFFFTSNCFTSLRMYIVNRYPRK